MNHLKAVSRSFYLSLKVLPAPVRDVMGIGYLFCRAADTIADTEAFPTSQRIERLIEFRDVITKRIPPAEVLENLFTNLREISGSTSPSEKQLLTSFKGIYEDYEYLPRSDQAFVNDVLRSVTEGMIFDLKTFGDSAESLQAMANEKELESYLHWIGGEPGRFWSKVCFHHLPSLKIHDSSKWMQDGIVFGTGLQMVNILRDLPEDLKKGRCYLPRTLLSEHGLTPEDLLTEDKNEYFLTLYHRLIDQTLLRLQRALPYIEQMPTSAWRMRVAVWLPLSIGVETLKLLRLEPHPLSPKTKIKVKRKTIYLLIVKSLFNLASHSAAKRAFSNSIL